METLTLNGKKYVKASKAAKDLGYASDYVGQLCRTGAVDAHLVGRTWYVNPDMLGAHRVEKKRNARVKAREYARKSISEARAIHVKQDTKSSQNIEIRYEHDSEELIPEVKKLSIASEKQILKEEQGNDESGYTIENKNEKILMSGSIPVYDVESETKLTDTTVLKPRIVKHRRDKTTTIEDAEHFNEAQDELQSNEHMSPEPSTFEEKLAVLEDATPETVQQDEPSIAPVDDPLPSSMARGSVLSTTVLAASILVSIISMMSTIFEATIAYSAQGTSESSYSIDTSDFSKIHFKI